MTYMWSVSIWKHQCPGWFMALSHLAMWSFIFQGAPSWKYWTHCIFHIFWWLGLARAMLWADHKAEMMMFSGCMCNTCLGYLNSWWRDSASVIYVSTAVLIFGVVGLVAQRDRLKCGGTIYGIFQDLYNNGVHHFVIVWLAALASGVRSVTCPPVQIAISC